jgi:hypothetical protein
MAASRSSIGLATRPSWVDCLVLGHHLYLPSDLPCPELAIAQLPATLVCGRHNALCSYRKGPTGPPMAEPGFDQVRPSNTRGPSQRERGHIGREARSQRRYWPCTDLAETLPDL